MKKTTTLLIGALLLSTFIYGQHSRSRLNCTKGKIDCLAREVIGHYNLDRNIGKLSRTTDQVSERLKAQCMYSNTFDSTLTTTSFLMVDSGRFNYSGSRTSYFNFNYMSFSNTYQINGSMMFGFGTNIGFNDANDRPDVMCDTSYHWSLNASYSLILSNTKYSIYDTADNILNYTSYQADTSYGGERYINGYDITHKIQHSTQFDRNSSGGWDSAAKRKFVYSGGHLVTDSTLTNNGTSVWTPEYKYQYEYDTASRIIGVHYYEYDLLFMKWMESERYSLSYYGDGNLKVIYQYYVDTAGNLETEMVDSFGWTTGLYYCTYFSQTSYLSGTPIDNVQYLKHIATDSFPDTMYTIYTDLTIATVYARDKNIYKYDRFGEPIRCDVYGQNLTTGLYDTLYETDYYYYETFLMRTRSEVSTIVSEKNLTIYPNPTSDNVIISLSDISPGGTAQIQITDVSGRLYRSIDGFKYGPSESISTADLPDGMYVVSITLTGAGTLHEKLLIKR